MDEEREKSRPAQRHRHAIHELMTNKQLFHRTILAAELRLEQKYVWHKNKRDMTRELLHTGAFFLATTVGISMDVSVAILWLL